MIRPLDDLYYNEAQTSGRPVVKYLAFRDVLTDREVATVRDEWRQRLNAQVDVQYHKRYQWRRRLVELYRVVL